MAEPDYSAPTLSSLTLSDVNVTDGGAVGAFAANASDIGRGVERVTIFFDRSFETSEGRRNFVQLGTFGDTFADGSASVSQFFSSATSAGTYNVSYVVVTDYAGNSRNYFASDLTNLGLDTSFVVTSNTAADTTAPTLSSLTLSDINVSNGGAIGAFAANASDVGRGVERVTIFFDRSFETSEGRRNFIQLGTSGDTFADGSASVSQFFSSATSSGTYNVSYVVVTDYAGNSRNYFASDLTNLGLDTSFVVTSDTAADTTAPTLSSLTLSDINVSNGGAIGAFAAKASDVGTGVERVTVFFDRSFETSEGRRNFIQLGTSGDTFADGSASINQFISSATGSGAYNVSYVVVADFAGNSRNYFASELTSLGIDTSFVVTDTSAGATAFVIAPESVREGTSDPITLSLILKDVGLVAVTTNVTVSFAADQSTAVNGADVIVSAFNGSYSVSQSPNGNYTIALPSVAVLDDLIAEGTETIAIRITAAGQVFDTGTDTTVVRISLLDNDGTSGVDNDFSADGYGDLLWRNINSGAFSTWGVTGNAGSNAFAPNLTYDDSVALNWDLQGSLDWNGDGVSDIVWREADGSMTIWTGTGTGGFAANQYSDDGVPTDWRIAATGDFNGDGRDDLIWRDVTGAIAEWQSSGSGFKYDVYTDAGVPTDWKLAGTADFNGDGRDDLAWRNDNTGALSIWHSTGDGFNFDSIVETSVDSSWELAALADFNGDGRDDILWRNIHSGVFTEWSSAGSNFRANTYVDETVSNDWEMVQAVDANGDGMADLFWRNTQSGHLSIWQSTGDNGFIANTGYDSSVSTDWTLIGATGLAINI